MKKLRLFGLLAVAMLLAFALVVSCESPAGSSGDGNGDGDGNSGGQSGGPALTSPGTPATGGGPTGGGTAVTGISLDITTLKLGVFGNRDKGKITATIAPATALNKDIVWTAYPSGIVDIDDITALTIEVDAIGVGTTTLTVKTADGSKTASCVVTVVETLNITGFIIKTAPKVTKYYTDDPAWLPEGGVLTVTYAEGPMEDIPFAVGYFPDDPPGTELSAGDKFVEITLIDDLDPKNLPITVEDPEITFIVDASAFTGQTVYYQGLAPTTLPTLTDTGANVETKWPGLVFGNKSSNTRAYPNPVTVSPGAVTVTLEIESVDLAYLAAVPPAEYGLDSTHIYEFAAAPTNKKVAGPTLTAKPLRTLSIAGGTANAKVPMGAGATAAATVKGYIVSGFKLDGNYSNNETKRLAFTDTDVDFGASDVLTAPGNVTVTITKEGKEATFTCALVDPDEEDDGVATFVVSNPPSKTEYFDGIEAATLDWTGLEFTLTYTGTGRKVYLTPPDATNLPNNVTIKGGAAVPAFVYGSADTSHVYTFLYDTEEYAATTTLKTYFFDTSKVELNKKLTYPIDFAAADFVTALDNIQAVYGNPPVTKKITTLQAGNLGLSSGSGVDPGVVGDEVTVTITFPGSSKEMKFMYKVVAN